MTDEQRPTPSGGGRVIESGWNEDGTIYTEFVEMTEDHWDFMCERLSDALPQQRHGDGGSAEQQPEADQQP